MKRARLLLELISGPMFLAAMTALLLAFAVPAQNRSIDDFFRQSTENLPDRSYGFGCG